MARIHEHVEAVEQHLSAIADVFSEPNANLFTANSDVIPKLERALNLKAGIDAAIAYAADKARAGDRVGSPRTVDYLMKELGLSFGEAIGRIKLGHQNHGIIVSPPPEPEPEPAPDPEPASEQESQHQETDEERKRREEQCRAEEERLKAERERAAEEQRRAEEAARAKARLKARQSRIGPEKLTIIRRELKNLNEHAKYRHHELYAQSIEQAGQRVPEDLREWVRNRVIRINRTTRDPNAAWKRRKLVLGRQDSDGGAPISGYVTGDTLARLETALAPAQQPGHLIDDPGAKDDRTLVQRRHDALSAILHNYSADKINRTGVGTVVVSMSAKDIDEMTDAGADHRYPTNTSAMLTPADILRLGATKYNFAVVHDPETGNPLNVGRTKRLATVEQRIALLATQLVCTNPDCTQPFCNCEIHHLKPWQFDGSTDIWNLTTICRPHHAANRDQRDGRGARGHAERDADTGRVGHRPVPRPGNPHPDIQLNHTERQEHSGGAKIRRQPWPVPPASRTTPDTAATPAPSSSDARPGMGPPGPPPPGPEPPTPTAVPEPLFPAPSFDDVPPCPPEGVEESAAPGCQPWLSRGHAA